MNPIDKYLADTPADQRAALERVRTIAKKHIPEVEEGISYGLPTLKYKGKYVIYFGAFKNHLSLFPGPRTDTVKKMLDAGKFKMAKGTIQFTPDNPVPEDVIKELVQARVKELQGV